MMLNNFPYMVIYKKENNKGRYKHIGAETDPFKVHESLMLDLIHKKLHKCTYITKIKDTPLNNGYRVITVYYTFGVKREYIIKD